MILKSQKIFLREFRVSDISEEYYLWMNDPEIVRFMESRYYRQSKEDIEKYVTGRNRENDHLFAIFLNEDESHIGNVRIGPISWIHRNADIGILIGRKDLWGKGYGSEAIRLATDFAFKNLCLHKLKAGIYEGNWGSQKAFRKAGYRLEGTLKEHVFFENEYHDIWIMGIINDSLWGDIHCNWIKS